MFAGYRAIPLEFGATPTKRGRYREVRGASQLKLPKWWAITLLGPIALIVSPIVVERATKKEIRMDMLAADGANDGRESYNLLLRVV